MSNRLTTTGQPKGILRMMPGITADRIVPASSVSELSTFTTAGATPGVPFLDSDVSAMFLKSSGTIPDSEVTVTIETLHGGLVGESEAQWMWSQPIDADLRPIINTGAGKGSIDDLRGWEWPAHVKYWEPIVWDNDPAVSQLDAVTLSDGRIYQAWKSNNGAGFDIFLRVRDPLTGEWGDTITVFTTTDTTRSVLLPCLVVFPDDRVVVYFLNYIDMGTEFQLQARVVYPNDYSVEDYETFCLKTTLDTATYGAPAGDSQLRGAMKPDGSVVLLLSVDDTYDFILQLGSYDYGHSFQVVGIETGTIHHHFPDIVYTNGIFVVSYVVREPATDDVVVYKNIAHWFDFVGDAPMVGSNTMTAALSVDNVGFGNSLVAAPDGRIYSVLQMGDASPPTKFAAQVFYSTDLGDNWLRCGYGDTGFGFWAYMTSGSADSCTYLTNCSATWQGGRLYVGSLFVHDENTTETEDTGSVVAFYLGGWSNQQKAFFESYDKDSFNQLGYKYTAFGFLDPDFNGWAATSTGGSHDATDGVIQIITINGQTHYWSRTGGTSIAFASAEWTFQSSSFTTMTHGDVGVQVQIDNGTLKYRFGLYLLGTTGTQGGIRLRDEIASTTIADIPLDHTSGGYTFRLEVYNNKFQLWYRPASSDDDEVWERAIDPFSGASYVGYSLTSTASTGAQTQVAWGHMFATTTGATGDATTLWRDVKVSFGLDLADTPSRSGIKKWFLADYIDYSTTDDFHGGYPFVAEPMWVTDGIYVIAAGGPTYDIDQWTVEPSYQYAIGNILPSTAPSPLHGWRSTTDDVDYQITFLVGDADIDSALASLVTEWAGNESFGCYASGCNFQTAALYGIDSSDAEQKIVDLTFTRWSALIYQTHGNTLIVASGGGTNYVGYGELVGSYLTTSESTTPKKITMNTEGQLNTASKTVTIWFEASGSETQGVDNTTAGNLIYGTKGFWVCHDPPSSSQFKAYRLKIPAQPTAEGYFTIGKLVFGPLMVFGRPPSFGHTTEVSQDNTILNKTNAGHSESRRLNENPIIRQLSWTDNIDESGLSSTTPDYIQFASPADVPAALYSDTARQLYGLFQQLGGADEPVVYIDTIPTTSNTGELRPERLLYGRITSSYQESNVIGEEGTTEVKQTTNLVIESER